MVARQSGRLATPWHFFNPPDLSMHNPFRFLLACVAATGWWAAGVLTHAAAPTDWLLDPSPFPARVTVSPDGRQLELGNGLLRRVIRIQPNAATVALDLPTTGESLLRGVKPEAIVELDGRRFEIGGLKGQPNYAFLRPEWVADLRADPAAFQFTGFEIGKPQERLAWKRTRHHAPDVKWPPAGVTLRLDFAWPSQDPSDGGRSSTGRSLLWDDTFQKLDPAWKVVASQREARISFQNEGKPGEIYALSGTHCFAERTLNTPVSLMEAVIQPGTDKDASWGPGLGLVFGTKVVEVNLRPGDRGQHGQFELRDQGRTELQRVKELSATDGGLDLTKGYRLRVRLLPGTLIWDVADAAQDPPVFHRLFELNHSDAAPTAVRVGKTDRQGGASDETPADAEWGRSRITQVRAYGPFDAVRARGELGTRMQDLKVSVHYELYDGLPVYSKWITVSNGTDRVVRVDRFSSEVLAWVERTSEVDELSDGRTPPNVHVETDMSFGGMMASGANRRS
jgi:hypothetical protein